jgi:hypothetical protein
MPNLYQNESSDPRTNAQRNLCGRTHYVDDDTLRFHKSRVILARHTGDGLLFAIVTSDSQNYENTKRGFRYVIFDLFGTVVQRYPDKIEMEWFRTSAQATKAMWSALNAIDSVNATRTGMLNATKHFDMEMARLERDLQQVLGQVA